MPINPYNLPPEFFNLVGIPEWMWGVGTEDQDFNTRASLFANYLGQNQSNPAYQMYADKASGLGITPDMDMQGIQTAIAQIMSLMRQGQIDPSSHLLNPNFKTSSYNPYSGPQVSPGGVNPTGPQIAPVPAGLRPPPKPRSNNPTRALPNQGNQNRQPMNRALPTAPQMPTLPAPAAPPPAAAPGPQVMPPPLGHGPRLFRGF